MSFLILFIICSLLAIAGDKPGKIKKHRGDDDKYYFRSNDRVVIIDNYQVRPLPRGLQKKLYRAGYLPRGWEKNYRAFPVLMERDLPPLQYGYQRGYYGNYAVVVDPKTRLIIDVIDLINEIRR